MTFKKRQIQDHTIDGAEYETSVSQIQQRLDAAQFGFPGPWGFTSGRYNEHVVFDADGCGAINPVCKPPEAGETSDEWVSVAGFIAHAPQDIEWLLNKHRKTRAALALSLQPDRTPRSKTVGVQSGCRARSEFIDSLVQELLEGLLNGNKSYVLEQLEELPARVAFAVLAKIFHELSSEHVVLLCNFLKESA